MSKYRESHMSGSKVGVAANTAMTGEEYVEVREHLTSRDDTHMQAEQHQQSRPKGKLKLQDIGNKDNSTKDNSPPEKKQKLSAEELQLKAVQSEKVALLKKLKQAVDKYRQEIDNGVDMLPKLASKGYPEQFNQHYRSVFDAHQLEADGAIELWKEESVKAPIRDVQRTGEVVKKNEEMNAVLQKIEAATKSFKAKEVKDLNSITSTGKT